MQRTLVFLLFVTCVTSQEPLQLCISTASVNCTRADEQSIGEKVTNTTIDHISSDNRTQAMMLLTREKKKQFHLNFIRESIFKRIKANDTQEYNNLNLTTKSMNETETEVSRLLHLMTSNRTVNESIDWSKEGHSFFLSTCHPDLQNQRFKSRRQMLLHFPLPSMPATASPLVHRSVALKLFKKAANASSGSGGSIRVSIRQTPLLPTESGTSGGRKIFVSESSVASTAVGWVSFDVTRFYTSRRYVTNNFMTEVETVDASDAAVDVASVWEQGDCREGDFPDQSLAPRLEIQIQNLTTAAASLGE